MVPKSGNAADKIVKLGITDVLTKMGLMGIQLRIALKNEVPPDFELIESNQENLPNSDPLLDQGSDNEATKNTIPENTARKNSSERNNQNIRRQQQKQSPKSKDIKDNSVNQNKVKEKGSVPTNTK